MDKQQAKNSIEELFSKAFDRERYQHFLRNLLNNYENRDKQYSGNYIPDAFKQHVKQYWRVGKYVDPDGEELDLLVVQVKTLNKLERARSALRNFAVNRLKQFEKEASLIAFYAEDDKGADWRFSFVKMEHEAYQDDKGKVKLRQELTPAKRYSYLVGVHENSHTASQQLLPLLVMDYADPKIEEIEAAFSIEKVTDEFFDQYKALFQKLAEHLKKQPYFKTNDPETLDHNVSRFAKKLLGQIVFLYFLQKKGWLGVPKNGRWGEGSKRFMRERFKQTISNGGAYYHDFLQYLFYEALADARKEQKDPGYYKKFDCRVPFLNGGLFEADYDWQNEIIDLPDTLFHNEEKTRNGDTGTGILDVFDRYNFTVKEDEPLEKEVAVDPEMLGKVFENMLEVTERKSKGAFYTPREIVHYMCQESLIHYLDNKLNTYSTTPELTDAQGDIFDNAQGQQNLGETVIKVSKTEIETLIRKGHLALENDTRVLGKGRETDTYKFQLPETVRNHASDIDKALATIKVCDPAIGSGAFLMGLLHEIVNTRLALAPHSGNSQSAYELKRHVIAENHYGVDIDPSAIDIARLRMWLSLIVDEDSFDNIEALPNLDYKIVCGDSLVGFPDNWNSPAFQKIETLKKEYLPETDHIKKAELKKKIDAQIVQRLNDSKRTCGYHVNFDFRLMFSEVWHVNGGFDVVIGNPPYVSAMALKKVMSPGDYKLLRSFYQSAKGATDQYIFFFERGLRILAGQSSSVLGYISPNRYLSASYGEGLRRYIHNKYRILKIADYSNIRVFKEASTYPVVTFLSIMSTFEYSVQTEKYNSSYLCVEKREFGSEKLDFLDSLIWGWLLNDKLPIVERLMDKSAPIGSVCKVNATSTAKEADEYHHLINSDNGYKLINTGTIDRYCSLWGKDELTDKKERFLTPYLPKNNSGISSNRHDLYSSKKIIFAKIALRTEAIYDYAGEFASINTNCFHSFSKQIDPKYILAWVNSSLFQFAFECFFEGLKMQGGYLLYSSPNLLKMFILETSEKHQALIATLTDYLSNLCNISECQLSQAYFDDIIDAIFLELYFPDELNGAGKVIIDNIGELKSISVIMSDEEKLSIIKSEFDRLYDPHHPIRNAVDTLDSVDVVRAIYASASRN